MAEADRSPEIGRAFYEAGPKRGAERLAAVLAEWDRKGWVRTPDPILAANHFLGLCNNRFFKARLSNYMPQLTEAQIAEEVGAAVDTFLRAFGPDSPI